MTLATSLSIAASAGQPPLMERQREIDLALSACPAAIAGKAAVYVLEATGSTPNTGPAFVAGEGTPQALIIVPVGGAHD